MQPLMSTTGGRRRASASDSCRAGKAPLAASVATRTAMSARGRSNPILLASAVPFNGGPLSARHPHMLGIDGRSTVLGMQAAQAQPLHR